MAVSCSAAYPLLAWDWELVHTCFESPRPTRSSRRISRACSLSDHVEIALYDNMERSGRVGCFTTNKYENISGVVVFDAEIGNESLEYKFVVYENPFALPATKLPPSLLQYRPTITYIVKGTDPRKPMPVLL
ncbi:MAG TPA: hypothetical protein VG714_07170 [Acidobacteriaceae bacterium]|nr:hypothetical protein [Acidobacteriaceae bacterium]